MKTEDISVESDDDGVTGSGTQSGTTQRPDAESDYLYASDVDDEDEKPDAARVRASPVKVANTKRRMPERWRANLPSDLVFEKIDGLFVSHNGLLPDQIKDWISRFVVYKRNSVDRAIHNLAVKTGGDRTCKPKVVKHTLTTGGVYVVTLRGNTGTQKYAVFNYEFATPCNAGVDDPRLVFKLGLDNIVWARPTTAGSPTEVKYDVPLFKVKNGALVAFPKSKLKMIERIILGNEIFPGIDFEHDKVILRFPSSYYKSDGMWRMYRV